MALPRRACRRGVGNAVSGEMTVSGVGSGLIATTVKPEGLPDEWMAKGYMMDVLFRIKERTVNGYRATVEIDEFWSYIRASNWEICLELEDECTLAIADRVICLECEDTIEKIEGAEIIVHEGNVYLIRAADKNKWIRPDGTIIRIYMVIGKIYYNNHELWEFLSEEEEDAFYKRRKWGKKMGR